MGLEREKGLSHACEAGDELQIWEQNVFQFLTLPTTHTTHMQALRSEEREREKEWDHRRVAEAKAGLVLESQLEKKQKDLRRKLAEENRQLAAEQRAKLV